MLFAAPQEVLDFVGVTSGKGLRSDRTIGVLIALCGSRDKYITRIDYIERGTGEAAGEILFGKYICQLQVRCMNNAFVLKRFSLLGLHEHFIRTKLIQRSFGLWRHRKFWQSFNAWI